jgi:hypothetical protein
MFRTPNRRKWRVRGMKAELEDFTSMSLVSKDNIMSTAAHSTSRSFQIEQEKDPSLAVSFWVVITYFAMHWYLQVFYL